MEMEIPINLKSAGKRLFRRGAGAVATAALLLTGAAALADPPVSMAPPIGQDSSSDYDTGYANTSQDSVFNWREVPQDEQAPIRRAIFDRGGYQLYDNAGETIVVPFTSNNLYAMKFAVSPTNEMFFVNDGDVPILYVPRNGYLENATVPGSRWYPFTKKFHPAIPVFFGIAPSWDDYVGMGWYSGMNYWGGYYCNEPYYRGGILIAVPGLFIEIGGRPYYGWDHYHDYYYRNPAPYRPTYYHHDVYRWAGHPRENDNRDFRGGGDRVTGPIGGSYGRGSHTYRGDGASNNGGNRGDRTFNNGGYRGDRTTNSGGRDGDHVFQGGRTGAGGRATGSFRTNDNGRPTTADAGRPTTGNRTFGGGGRTFNNGHTTTGGRTFEGGRPTIAGHMPEAGGTSNGDRTFGGGRTPTGDRTFGSGRTSPGDRTFGGGRTSTGDRTLSGGGSSGGGRTFEGGRPSGGDRTFGGGDRPTFSGGAPEGTRPTPSTDNSSSTRTGTSSTRIDTGGGDRGTRSWGGDRPANNDRSSSDNRSSGGGDRPSGGDRSSGDGGDRGSFGSGGGRGFSGGRGR